MGALEPFASQLDPGKGGLQPVGRVIRRHLSEMQQIFSDSLALDRILQDEGDRLVYEVYLAELPEEEGHLLFSTTIIYPGRVGEEFHMTKGHFHLKRDRAEVYYGLSGEGYLLLQKDDGMVHSIPMGPGTVAYVPPFWAHRMVNTGDAPFVFLAVWPGDAGHDYATIERKRFAKTLVWRDGRVVMTDNPLHK